MDATLGVKDTSGAQGVPDTLIHPVFQGNVYIVLKGFQPARGRPDADDDGAILAQFSLVFHVSLESIPLPAPRAVSLKANRL